MKLGTTIKAAYPAICGVCGFFVVKKTIDCENCVSLENLMMHWLSYLGLSKSARNTITMLHRILDIGATGLLGSG